MLNIGYAYVIFLLISSPAIISYYEFLPYYSRGSGLSLTRASSNPFELFSLTSYLLPSAPAKADFMVTDATMRNAYVGLFVLVFFVLSLFQLNNFKKIIFGFTIFFFLFSLGDLLPVQRLCYEFLPLMDTFRHPGTMRLFTSLGIILLAAYALDVFLKTGKQKPVLTISYILLILLTGSVIYFLTTDQTPSYNNNISLDPASIKQYLHGISFIRFAAYLAIIQLVFVIAFIIIQKQKNWQKKLPVLIILNSIVFAWIALPFTVVSQYQTKSVNQFLNSFPDGYPTEQLNASVETGMSTDSAERSVHGFPKFYNKTISIQDHIITPTLNSDYGKYLKNYELRSSLKGKRFVYITDSTGSQNESSVLLKKFTPNQFIFEISPSSRSQFVIFQQYNHNWEARVNNKRVPIHKANLAFMRIDVPAGHSIVEWKYKPFKVYIGMLISFVCLIAVLLYFVLRRKTKTVHE